eukprot:m.89249 g.89249  ORF g.89249 m.89249 type:complete len:1740 (+) comp20041_c0_seq2:179-5398(+)
MADGGAAGTAPPGRCETTLREYLVGHVLRTALFTFEALGPWVKARVRERYPPSPEEAARLEEHRLLLQDWQARVTKLKADRAEVETEFKTCPKERKEEVALRRKALKDACATATKARPPDPPPPEWVAKCVEALGRRMKGHVTAESRWDTHTIAVVMRALLPEVFAAGQGDPEDAKALLKCVVDLTEDRARRAHGAHDLTEADVRAALSRIVAVLARCGRDADAAKVQGLLETAQHTVTAANGGAEAVDGPTLTAAEANAQQLFAALGRWDLHVSTVVGQPLRFQDRTVSFGDGLGPQWAAVVRQKQVKADLQTIAVQGRHWYFHHLDGEPDFAEVYRAMARVVDVLAAATSGAEGGVGSTTEAWTPPAVATTPVAISLRLERPSAHMSLPAPVSIVVGRDTVIDDIVRALTPQDGGPAGPARVLVHGAPGVGKDTVMAKVAKRPELAELSGLKGWLCASSDRRFRSELVALFATHHPDVVGSAGADLERSVGAIQGWLRTHHDWTLFVEDATLGCDTLWRVIPPAGGRLLLTSQATLHRTHCSLHPVELGPITTDESLELLRRMDPFSRKAPPPPADEAELELECEIAGCPEVYKPPPAAESAAAAAARQAQVEAVRFLKTELDRPELRQFLEGILGNLPLSVAQCGHVARSDPAIRSVKDLIALFAAATGLAEMDGRGRNPQQDTHFYGLDQSVRFAVTRLQQADDTPPDDRAAAVTLLCALAVLDPAGVPMWLLQLNSLAVVAAWLGVADSCACEADASILFLLMGDARPRRCSSAVCALTVLNVFSDRDVLDRARDLCIRYGLLMPPAVLSDTAGVLHQAVRSGLQQTLVTGTVQGDTVAKVVRSILRQSLPSNYPHSSNRSRLRALAPSLKAWCECVTSPAVMAGADGPERTATVLPATAADAGLLDGLAWLLRTGGDARGSAVWARQCQDLLCRLDPANDTQRAATASSLVWALCGEGRFQAAVDEAKAAVQFLRTRSLTDAVIFGRALADLGHALRCNGDANAATPVLEEAVAHHKRGTAVPTLSVASAFSNLATAYDAVGRHEEAVALKETSLAMHREVLADDDPEIAVVVGNLAVSYLRLGRHKDGERLANDAVRRHRLEFGNHHPCVATAVSILGHACLAQGRHTDALAHFEAALAIFRAVHPPDHPETATLMGNVAGVRQRMGRNADALAMRRKVLAMRQRVLQPNHSDIANAWYELAGAHTHGADIEAAVRCTREAVQIFEKIGTRADFFEYKESREIIEAADEHLKLAEGIRLLKKQTVRVPKCDATAFGDGDQAPLGGGPQGHDAAAAAVQAVTLAVATKTLSAFALTCVRGDVTKARRMLEAAGRTGADRLHDFRDTPLRLPPLLLVTVVSKQAVAGLLAPSPSLVEVAELLVEFGARVDARCSMGRTVVHYGACAAATPHSLAIARLCLRAHPSASLCGVDVRLTGMASAAYEGAVGRCGGYSHPEIGRRVVELSDRGKSVKVKPGQLVLVSTGQPPDPPSTPLVDVPDRVGCVALLDVVGSSRADVIELLLGTYSARLDIADSSGVSPLSMTLARAAAGEQLEVSVRRAMHRLAPSGGRKCNACGIEGGKLQACGGCGKSWYCSTACQRKDWQGHHKKVCRAHSKTETLIPMTIPSGVLPGEQVCSEPRGQQQPGEPFWVKIQANSLGRPGLPLQVYDKSRVCHFMTDPTTVGHTKVEKAIFGRGEKGHLGGTKVYFRARIETAGSLAVFVNQTATAASMPW